MGSKGIITSRSYLYLVGFHLIHQGAISIARQYGHLTNLSLWSGKDESEANQIHLKEGWVLRYLTKSQAAKHLDNLIIVTSLTPPGRFYPRVCSVVIPFLDTALFVNRGILRG